MEMLTSNKYYRAWSNSILNDPPTVIQYGVSQSPYGKGFVPVVFINGRSSYYSGVVPKRASTALRYAKEMANEQARGRKDISIVKWPLSVI